MGVFSAEGGQFVAGHGMNADNKIKTSTGLSSLWDGTDIRRVRAGDGASIIAGKRVSMHLMMQPKLSMKLFSDDDLKDQGLLSRMLVSYPHSTIGTRFFKEPPQSALDALELYTQRILSILKTPLPIKDNTQNELSPRVIRLSDGAKKLWINYLNHIEKNTGASSPLEPIKGLALKLPEHACRLAGVLTLVDDIHAANIEENTMKNAIELAEYYGSEALRLFNVGFIDPNILLAERLLEWLHNNWMEKLISLPDIVLPIKNKT